MRTARIAISTKPMLSAGSNAPAAAATAATRIMQISDARPASFIHARICAEEGRPAEQRRDEEHRVLEDAREKLRGEKRAGDAAEDAAERHADVELGQAGRGGPPTIERAVAQHRVDEEQGEMKREAKGERHARDGGHQRQRRAPDLEASKHRRRDESLVAEGEDEGDEEQRQRHTPSSGAAAMSVEMRA